MQPDFWQKKWQSPQQGFNQKIPNALLVTYVNNLNLAKGSTIFVPLAGKSVDMVWLAEQGYDVVGIELVESAVTDFFDEQAIKATIKKHATTKGLTQYKGRHAGQTITLWAGDIFDLTREDTGKLDGVYDRAALVALPDDGDNSLRRRYVQKVIELTNHAPQLLINFTVNEAILDAQKGFDRKTFGPPFVIEDSDINDYYQDTYHVKFLAKETPNDTDVLVNQAWLLMPKPQSNK